RLLPQPATTATYSLSLHDALPIYVRNTAPAASVNAEQAVAENAVADGPTNAALDALNIKPIDASARSLQFSSTSNTPLKTFVPRSEEHTSELQSRENLVCRLLLEK